MLLYRPSPLSSFIIASDSFFCVIGSPICTAVAGLPELSASDENVAPCIPSCPTLPPIITILSPFCAAFSQLALLFIVLGISPIVPTKTNGFPL